MVPGLLDNMENALSERNFYNPHLSQDMWIFPTTFRIDNISTAKTHIKQTATNDLSSEKCSGR